MRAILIEPYTGMRVTLRGVLRAFGITQLYEPKTSLDAIHILLQGPVDFLISADQVKPYDARLLLKLIRQASEEDIRLTRALITFDSDPEQEQKLINAGCDDILHKPFSADDLCARLNRLIRKRRPFIENKTYVGPDRRQMDITINHNDRRNPLSNPGKADFRFTLKQLFNKLLKAEAQLIEKRKQADNEFGSHIKCLTLKQLDFGQRLAKPVITTSGITILAADSFLKTKAIDRLKDLLHSGKIKNEFYISVEDEEYI